MLTHQRNREQQGDALRAQALAIQNLIDPLPAPLPPTRSEIAAAQRATSIEVAKDRWNHEVLSALRWAQNTDWDEVRGGIEQGVSNLWTKAFGDSPAEDAEKAKAQLQAGARKVEGKAEDAGLGVADAARAAYLKAKSKSISVEEAAENKALEARLKVDKEASEAKGTLATAWESGKEKAKGIAEKAKAAVITAEDKLQVKKDGKIMPATSPVEKALHERFEAPEAKVNKTVAEALKERYIPLSERDNTVLRGL